MHPSLALRTLCLTLMRLVLVVAFNPASAASWGGQSAYLEDPAGTITIDEVEQHLPAFQPYTGVLAKGYTPSTFWLRIEVVATTEPQLILRIRPTYIDRIELYDPLAIRQGVATPQLSGDRHPRATRNYQSLNHGFVIPGSAEPRFVYLRLQSTSTMLVYPQVMTTLEAQYADHRQEFLYSIYLGLLAALIIWAMLQWSASREIVTAAFVIKQVVVLIHALAVQGYLPLLFGEWLSAPAIDIMTSVVFITYVLVGAAFNLLLQLEFKPAPWLWRFFALLLLLYVPVIGLFITGNLQLALQINITLATLETVGLLLIALSTRAWKDPTASRPPPIPRWVFITLCSALVLATFSAALPILLGVTESPEWELISPMFAGFVSSLLMTILLAVRARNLEKYQRRVTMALELSQREASLERARREEQERFLAMLTHELKTPLGVARISLGASRLTGLQRDRIDRALTNINAIISRCEMTDRLEQRHLLPSHERCDLTELVEQCVAFCEAPGRVKVSERFSASVQSDLQLLQMCVANLIDNALKYSPADSVITVDIVPQPNPDDRRVEGLAVEVRNRIGAAGVPDTTKLFSKYYRSPGAHSKSGSGLGLYLTHSVAQLLGQKLSFGVKDEHVYFRLWIPA